jgi:hypothetical protein
MLRRIADALGQSEAVFRVGGAPASDLVEQTELLQIWGSLTDHSDRRKVLAFARAVAAGRASQSRS